MLKGVIFDFSGTLFRCEDTEPWLRGTLAAAGIEAADEEVAVYAARLADSGGQPGGHTDFAVPGHLADLWARRDLSAENHRAAYTALIERAGLPWPGLADLLYDRHSAPAAWHPYPDAAAALRLLQDRGIRVAVLSNIAWDLRTVFKHHGLDHLVDAYVLSYEVGCKKPDPRIFQAACDLLAQSPTGVLMVGDDPVADAGALALGCAFSLVRHLAVDRRPRALLDALAELA